MKLMDVLFGRMIDRKIVEYQSDLMEKHCEEVQNIYETMRGWRHDYHNHSVKNGTAHGLGLRRVDRIVEKNQGFVNRQNEEGVFATEIMLPLF